MGANKTIDPGCNVIGAHWFQITVTCVKERIVGKDEKRPKNWEGAGKIVILSTSTSTQIPNYKTSRKKKKERSKQHSKQAIRQGSWVELQNVC